MELHEGGMKGCLSGKEKYNREVHRPPRTSWRHHLEAAVTEPTTWCSFPQNFGGHCAITGQLTGAEIAAGQVKKASCGAEAAALGHKWSIVTEMGDKGIRVRLDVQT
jgi:hypothetical protein